MFLNLLNTREAKDFLELASIAMKIDGVEKESELEVLDTYRRELALPDYEIQGKDQATLVTAFQASTKKVKKVIIIELAGVLDADEVIDEVENAWIMKLGSDWGFRDSEIRKMVRWTQDFNDLLNEAVDFINKR